LVKNNNQNAIHIAHTNRTSREWIKFNETRRNAFSPPTIYYYYTTTTTTTTTTQARFYVGAGGNCPPKTSNLPPTPVGHETLFDELKASV